MVLTFGRIFAEGESVEMKQYFHSGEREEDKSLG